MERYRQIEEILDKIEDTALGFLAKEREFESKPSDYMDIREAEDKMKNCSQG